MSDEEQPDRARPGAVGIAAGAVFAPLAAISFWTLADDVSWSRGFGTPIPYVMIAASWLVGLPVYFLLADWLKLRLERFLLAAFLPAMLPVAYAYATLQLPRAHLAASMLLGTVFSAVFAFWLSLWLFRRQGVQPPPR